MQDVVGLFFFCCCCFVFVFCFVVVVLIFFFFFVFFVCSKWSLFPNPVTIYYHVTDWEFSLFGGGSEQQWW